MKPYQRQDFICELTGVTPNAKLVLFVLSRHAQDDSMTCWLSWETLKIKTGIKSNDGIDAALKRLEARGVLTIKRPPKHAGCKQSSVYTLKFDPDGILRPAEHSTLSNTPIRSSEYSDSASGILRPAETNLLTIKKNHGASASALEAHAPRRSRPPAPRESPDEKDRQRNAERMQRIEDEAKQCGFRRPAPHESPGGYATQLKWFQEDKH